MPCGAPAPPRTLASSPASLPLWLRYPSGLATPTRVNRNRRPGPAHASRTSRGGHDSVVSPRGLGSGGKGRQQAQPSSQTPCDTAWAELRRGGTLPSQTSDACRDERTSAPMACMRLIPACDRIHYPVPPTSSHVLSPSCSRVLLLALVCSSRSRLLSSSRAFFPSSSLSLPNRATRRSSPSSAARARAAAPSSR